MLPFRLFLSCASPVAGIGLALATSLAGVGNAVAQPRQDAAAALHSENEKLPAALTLPTRKGVLPAGDGQPAEAACFAVDIISIEGKHDLVPAQELERAASPFTLDCQGNASVGGLMKAINGLYADKGFITTQAMLPEQDIAGSRKLVLTVVPGRIDKIVYAEEREPYRWVVPRMASVTRDLRQATGPLDLLNRIDRWAEGLDDELEYMTLLGPSSRLAQAQTVAPDDVLHVDALQDTIDSLNRVPSHQAKADLKPGSRPATSEIAIANAVTDTFRLYAGYDTESIEGVDRLRFGVTAEKDNLVGINDTWGATLRSGVDTNELTGDVAVPVGRFTARANANWSETVTQIEPLAELFTTTWSATGGGDWIAHASKTGRLTMDATLTHWEQNRYINGVDLARQSVTHLRTGATFARLFARGSLSGRLGIDAGLPILNANKDPAGLDYSTPRSQFTKYEMDLTASYVFPGQASLSSNLSGQWTDDPLLSDFQLTIGSRSSVRGYSNASFKADRGLVWRNEIAFSIPDTLFGKPRPPASGDGSAKAKPAASEWWRAPLSRLNPYVFLDAGCGQDIANDIDGYRIGSGFGLRYGGPRLSFDGGYAFRLAADGETFRSDDKKGEVFVNLRLKVF